MTQKQQEWVEALARLRDYANDALAACHDRGPSSAFARVVTRSIREDTENMLSLAESISLLDQYKS